MIFDLFFHSSSYQGWDNPFRPEGELSHDAEEILRLWKEGKLKDFSLLLKAKEEQLQHEAETRMLNKDENDCHEPLLTTQNGSAKTFIKNGQQSKKAEGKKAKPGMDEPKKKQGCCSLM